MAPQKRKRRYYIFLGDLYLSKDGKDRKIREATKADKKRYKTGIVGDTAMDIADTVTELFSSKDKKPQKKSYKQKAKIQKETPTDESVFTKAGKFVSGQFSNRKKLFGPQDYRKGGMVINTTDNRKNK
jgi:hypothetical protein